MPIYGFRSWTPNYVPALSLSPKLYTLVRNIQMASFERQSSIREMMHTDEETLDESKVGELREIVALANLVLIH
jgi:hypothetical protein